MAAGNYSMEVRELHNEMVNVLAGDLGPTVKPQWDKLLGLFSNRAPLTTLQIATINNIGDLVRELMTAEYICFENYEPFAAKLEKVNNQMARVVRQYGLKIMEEIEKDGVSQR
ncbi:uncharacterized protein LOC117340239 [Pecten maximus]|uniref:uncharacterized protein LOC117340239 n=1 Tax=Pecten maximus TaxID=6579 RepID=UPI001458AFC9|nr:uncharacterized protein LOC117340239 [Pecten maximus]XP_033757891.1 uncharacterized protein LOC117340239 [Pecten maximus]